MDVYTKICEFHESEFKIEGVCYATVAEREDGLGESIMMSTEGNDFILRYKCIVIFSTNTILIVYNYI